MVWYDQYGMVHILSLNNVKKKSLRQYSSAIKFSEIHDIIGRPSASDFSTTRKYASKLQRVILVSEYIIGQAKRKYDLHTTFWSTWKQLPASY